MYSAVVFISLCCSESVSTLEQIGKLGSPEQNQFFFSIGTSSIKIVIVWRMGMEQTYDFEK